MEGGIALQENLVFIYMIVIGICSVIPTVFMAMRSKRKFTKYIPMIIVLALALILCIAYTIFDYSRYIGILYVGVLMIITPACILCIAISLLFELIHYIKRKTT